MKDVFDRCVSRSTITLLPLDTPLKHQSPSLVPYSGKAITFQKCLFLSETLRMAKVTLFLPLTPQLFEQEKARTMEK